MVNNIAAKNTRALELLAALRYGGWNNAEFWEAQQLLRTTAGRDMTEAMDNLLFRWCDEEERRINSGTHEGCGPELEAEITAKWPWT